MRTLKLCLAFGLTTIAPGFFAQAQTTGTTAPATTTPIQNLVVIFNENNSFDHYFGTYPNATNPKGSPVFIPAPNTPGVNGLNGPLLTNNLNSTGPFRLDRSQALTCDNNNGYMAEQSAYNHGLANKFPEFTAAAAEGCTPALSMGYYDGNTVTALWNYAQHFSMSDNFYATEFGTTVMGHMNLLSGQTHQTNTATIAGVIANGSIIANVNPVTDDCTSGKTVEMTSKNVGDLLNSKGITWGWFYADFDPLSNAANGTATCSSLYNVHYMPFQYWASTANPHHLPPSSPAMIGQQDQANHQYSLADLWNLVANGGTLPAVTFLKATSSQTGHPANSTPLEEQAFLVQTINFLQSLPQWSNMAILITYDDSDGWYDHVTPPIVSSSADPALDTLAGTSGLCGTLAAGSYNDRCGYGPRLPLVVISPFARQNFVDHTVADQSSILRFIEDNWQLGRIGDQSFDAVAGPLTNLFNFSATTPAPPVFLDPATGQVVK
jgi:phospholipase C